MKPYSRLEEAVAPGGSSLVLLEHDGEYVLRVRGRELMSSRRVASEVRLGELAGEGVGAKRGGRVLVGGLGLGFTLRAALGAVPRDTEVVVAELMPEVVAWNRNPSYGLACRELEDRRTRVVIGDLFDVLAESPGLFDAILLDADNQTTDMMTRGNRRVYEAAGLSVVLAALRPDGLVAYWSPTAADPRLVKQLARAGLEVRTEVIRAYGAGGPRHSVIVGRSGSVGKGTRARE